MELRRETRLFGWDVVFTSQTRNGMAIVQRRPWRVGKTLHCILTSNHRAGPSYTLYEKRRFDLRTLRKHSDSTFDGPFDARFFSDGHTYGRTLAVMTAPVRQALLTLADAGEVSYANYELVFRSPQGSEALAHTLWPSLTEAFVALSEPLFEDPLIFERIAARFLDEPNAKTRANFCYYANASRAPLGFAKYAEAAANDPSAYVRAVFAGYRNDLALVLKIYASAGSDQDAINHCSWLLARKENTDAALVEQAIVLDLASDLYLIDLLARLAALKGKAAIPVIERAIATHQFSYAPRKKDAAAVLALLGAPMAGQLSIVGAQGGELSQPSE